MVEKQVSVRIATIGGKAVKADFTEIGREGKRALNDIERSSGGSRVALQNVGFQVQDFAVQVAGGTAASRALAQQLPQLLSGFGLLGVALGTAAAVFTPLIAGMMGGEDSAKGLSDSIKDLESSSRDYDAAMRDALTPMEELRKGFGDQAVAVRDLFDARLALEQLDFLGSQRKTAGALAQTFSEVSEIIGRINDLKSAISDPSAQIGAQIELETQIGRLQREFGLTVDQANELQTALNNLSTAEGPKEVAAATLAIREAMIGAGNAAGGLPEPMREAVQNAIDLELQARELAAKMGISVEKARELGSTDMSGGLREANAQALTLVERITLAINRGARAQDYLKNAKIIGMYQQYADSRLAAPDVPVVHATKGGGGGGVSEAQKEQNKLMEEAKRVIASTRTETEKYKDELAKLDEMLAQHLLTQDQYNRAVADLKDKFGGVGEAAKKMGDDIGKALEDIIIGGEDANQVISKLLASFASEMFQSGWSKLMGSLTGGGGGMGSIFDLFGGSFLGGFAKGGVFAGGNVIPFASGGVVSSPTHFPMRGGLGLMGEAGPEAIMPLRRGSDGKLGVAVGAGGGTSVTVQVTVDARGAVEGVAQQVSDAVRRQIPGIVKQAVAGVAAAKKRAYPV